ncbi:NlpC/P60 family protein [Hyphobacterium marinum]|uniref:NlpC/P60 family protein n=1 Tax=Hyphobacterium marinum TaxID=3116574 RepID=A0ABU7M0I0_9PROT|nr:NlpC/P60 family protein [Hyphobacterium sp. Y6023]MEE2567322.1 NlpC/P60 family protein [Hyphobacterium sp. Y6023]
MSPSPDRAAIVAEARSWIGTPYRHQASLKGAGCDCLGLVRGVWRNCVGAEPESPPAYTPDWAERSGAETLLEAARRWLVEIDLAAREPGDVMLFRPFANGPTKHCGILTAPGRLTHAYWGRAVCETSLTPWWIGRLVATFQFPSYVN